MVNFLNILRVVVALIPLVTDLVRQIEAAIPQSGQGAAKLEMVRQMLQSTYDKANDATVAFEQIWPTVQSLVASLVTIYNNLGLFKKAP